METFQPPRPFVPHQQYALDRQQALASLDLRAVDTPIRGIISEISRIPHCFTLQCCYGHFLYPGQENAHDLQALPDHDIGMVRYRIAYLALCIEDSPKGRYLRTQLNQVTEIDPAYVQFGSPDWFWERQVNTYALQVEPQQFMHLDAASMPYQEALRVQDVRERFFERLDAVVRAATI